jgi:recombinational DNA repair protein (RecF pathway)
MSLMQDIGIFLAGSRTGESDIKADIYTRGKGKRSFIFKGILKSKKRSGWAMEGNILNITFYEHETRDAQHVQDAELLFSPFNANLDFTRISLLFKILKTTRDLVPYEEATERLFL